MNISITGHHVHVTDSVRRYINKRLKKIENHFHQPTNVEIVLHKEHDSFQLEATLHGKKTINSCPFTFHGHVSSD